MFKPKFICYSDANNMPAKRYVLGISKDLRYFIKGDIDIIITKKYNDRKLKSKVQIFNKTLCSKNNLNIDINKIILKEIKVKVTKGLCLLISNLNLIEENYKISNEKLLDILKKSNTLDILSQYNVTDNDNQNTLNLRDIILNYKK